MQPSEGYVAGSIPAGRAIVLAALLGFAPAPFAADSPSVPATVQVGQLIGDASMRGLNGPSRRLSDYRGQSLVVNVWASWCGPCRQEMASLERLAWQPGAVGFAVIGISTDDYPDRALELLRRSNATISHFIDRDLQLESLFGATRLPLTVLLDADGRVVEKVYGAQEWDSPASRALIERAFGRRPGLKRP